MTKYRSVVVEDGGKLNNYAIEPEMYQAAPATNQQKRNVLILGIATAVLVVTLVFVAISVS
jgi:hypothetical protein